jgi:hypothetical protein
MATTSRLSLYNGALRLLGERQLASLAENREPRRMLDAVWDDNVIQRALEAGQWLFATRSMMYDYSPSVEPEFGYQRAFNKPDDFVRTTAVCSDEYFRVPLTDYSDEAGYWFADLDTIYVKYVCNAAEYGGDMSRWPQTFVKYLEALMASEIAMPLKQNKQARDDMLTIAQEYLKDAGSKNAMADPAKFLPKGGWASARGGRITRTGQP